MEETYYTLELIHMFLHGAAGFFNAIAYFFNSEVLKLIKNDVCICFGINR